MIRLTPQFTPVVGTEIFDLRPDYSAISVVADGVDNVAHHPGGGSVCRGVLDAPSAPVLDRGSRGGVADYLSRVWRETAADTMFGRRIADEVRQGRSAADNQRGSRPV